MPKSKCTKYRDYFDWGVIDKVSSKLSSSPKLIIIFTFYFSKFEKLNSWPLN